MGDEKKKMTMTLRPLQDRVVVSRMEAEERTAGGLFIPEGAKEPPAIGTVVAAGNGRIRPDGGIQPLDVKAGDKILFGKYAGSDIELDDEKLVILREDDVYGVLE